MTKKQAENFIDELGCKNAVKQIFALLNGENYSDAVKILDAVKAYLQVGTFVDADLINGLIDATDE